MKKIKYICFYEDKANDKEQRTKSLAAENKVKYLSQCLVENGYLVEIVNPAWTYGKKFCRGTLSRVEESIILRLFSSIPWGNGRLSKGISVVFQLLQLFLYLLFRVKKSETVLVYHSLYYAPIFHFLKKLKKFHLLLEVEEIYTDVKQYPDFLKKSEYSVFQAADSFLLSNHLLTEKINKNNRPYLVFNGSYEPKKLVAEKFSDGKIHLVYSGIIDQYKGGATIAVRVAEFLDERYHLHILGFGAKEDVAKLQCEIQEISPKTACQITYEGVLYGDEFQKFLQQCHIGLSTQNPDKQYNDTSFPSKVLVYLTNGLRVVSSDIPVVNGSAVGDLITYYSKNESECIAQAIQSIGAVEKDDVKNHLLKIDSLFKSELKNLL